MEKEQSRYQSLGWRLARARIGQLVRENYRVDQQISPRLAALITKLENGSPELPGDMFKFPAKSTATSTSRGGPAKRTFQRSGIVITNSIHALIIAVIFFLIGLTIAALIIYFAVP
jgi:hypothetical protein